MRKCFIALAFSVSSVFSTAAFAQNWSGFYVGAHAGYGWAEADGSLTGGDANGAPIVTDLAAAGAATSISTDDGGFLGGVQAGYNFQSGTFVWGVEADISWADIEGDGSHTSEPVPSFLGPVNATSVVGSELEWLGTVRLRGGLLVTPSALIYATGGFAYGRVEHSWETNVNFLAGPVTVPVFSGSKSGWETGWTIGGGGEFLLSDGLSLRGEYLYYDLGDTSYSAPLDPAIGVGKVNIESENTGHVVRAALNIKLDQ